ncbi:MAG: DUF4331 domain-containing protein [Acidobacteria bacterium]|nr:DUF4331 domain-containing protein [Acidobacteriota bacterium]
MKVLGRASTIALSVLSCWVATPAAASSHREAPAITKSPKVDATDFYMFRSYEPGRAGYVTLLANYQPFQDPAGGPNFYMLDPDALYEIHVDNNGDAREDITFQFQFRNQSRNLKIGVGDKQLPVPVLNLGPIGPRVSDHANLNVVESYTLSMIRGSRKTGEKQTVLPIGASTFLKPVDRIGDKSIRDNDPTAYQTYADDHVYDMQIPGCSAPGRVFVGQRREGFVIDVSEAFDLFNMNILGPRDGKLNDLAAKNVTTLALEVPTQCLALPGQPIIGGWTTASVSNDDSKGQAGRGSYRQVSRLASPLVNEVVIGLPDKDKFNASDPSDDKQFLDYVTNPTLPAILKVLFPQVMPPTVFPRADLVAVFLTGVTGLNQPPSVVPSEMLRLNTSIDPKAPAAQKSLGVLEQDQAGFPNGRRPGDDVVDIELRVLMGALLPLSQAPDGNKPFTDGALTNATIAYTPDGRITSSPAFALFRSTFPYLQTPLSSSPQPIHP